MRRVFRTTGAVLLRYRWIVGIGSPVAPANWRFVHPDLTLIPRPHADIHAPLVEYKKAGWPVAAATRQPKYLLREPVGSAHVHTKQSTARQNRRAVR